MFFFPTIANIMQTLISAVFNPSTMYCESYLLFSMKHDTVRVFLTELSHAPMCQTQAFSPFILT